MDQLMGNFDETVWDHRVIFLSIKKEAIEVDSFIRNYEFHTGLKNETFLS